MARQNERNWLLSRWNGHSLGFGWYCKLSLLHTGQDSICDTRLDGSSGRLDQRGIASLGHDGIFDNVHLLGHLPADNLGHHGRSAERSRQDSRRGGHIGLVQIGLDVDVGLLQDLLGGRRRQNGVGIDAGLCDGIDKVQCRRLQINYDG